MDYKHFEVSCADAVLPGQRPHRGGLHHQLPSLGRRPPPFLRLW